VVPESRESLTTPPKSPPPRRSCQCPQLAWHCQWLQWRRGAASGRCGAAVVQHCSSGDSVRDCQPSGRLMSYQSSVSQAPPAGLAATGSGCHWQPALASFSLLPSCAGPTASALQKTYKQKMQAAGSNVQVRATVEHCIQPLFYYLSPLFGIRATSRRSLISPHF